VGIGLSFRPARLHRLAELIPELFKSLKILAQAKLCLKQGCYKEMRCRFFWLTNSALVYEPKCRGSCGLAGSHPMSTAVHMEPK
jgi:hypothetical protein